MKNKIAAPAGPNLKRRGRGPSPDKTAATRAVIIAAGRRAFIDNGFERTRMIDVARNAGLAKGTLYLHFATKEALFEAILHKVVGSPLGDLAIAPGPDQTVREFILAAAVPALRELEASGRADLLRLIIREGGNFPEIAASYRRAILEPGAAAVARLMELAVKRGELKTDALMRQPLLLISPALTATIWNGLFQDEPISAADSFEAFVDTVFR